MSHRTTVLSRFRDAGFAMAVAAVVSACMIGNARSEPVSQHLHPSDGPEWPGTADEGRLWAVASWIAIGYGLPLPRELPTVYFVLPPRAAPTRGVAAREPGAGALDIIAYYDSEARAIFLPRSWTGSTAFEQSVLIHEMVHFMQHEAGIAYPCGNAREKLAYAVQADWLARFDLDLVEALGTDAFSLMFRTECPF